MEEDIKILEEQLNTYKRHIENYQKEECLTRVYYELKSYATALENLIKGYKREKEDNEELKRLANNKQWISPCYVAQNYIPKSKIKEKIKKIEKEKQEYEEKYSIDADYCFDINGYNSALIALKKLMEDK